MQAQVEQRSKNIIYLKFHNGLRW